MKNLIFILVLIMPNLIFSQSEILNFTKELSSCKMSGTQIGKRVKVGAQFFPATMEVADVKRFFLKDGIYKKNGFSKNRLFGGFSFTPHAVGKYFVIISFKDSRKNRMVEISVFENRFELKLFKKGLPNPKKVKIRNNKVGVLSKSDLPDFDNAIKANFEGDFFGCDLREERFIKLANCKKYLSGNVTVEYFYKKNEKGKLYLLVDAIQADAKKIGLHAPWEGIYFVKIFNKKGIYFFKLEASNEKGRGFELFESS